ncbi:MULTISPECIES: hypothetical protein [Cellulophaga]|nr:MULTISPECIES: hypothetical protein [Cellulophaga]MDO6768754.1 hypothetical protein [Cellulophaga sp. 1_MG-2023]
MEYYLLGFSFCYILFAVIIIVRAQKQLNKEINIESEDKQKD